LGKQSLQVTFLASHRNKFKLFLIQGFLCDQIHTARALGFRQRINTPELYWLSSYKATAINARNFCIRMSAELVHIKDESENLFIKCKLSKNSRFFFI
jgi:hypothetical protein